MKLTLPWKSEPQMRALFSNLGQQDENNFYLLMVFHKSMKGGFSRIISIEECEKILKKKSKNYKFIPYEALLEQAGVEDTSSKENKKEEIPF